jgi:conjugal transfer pilin signal peptidase TrbI
MSGLKTRLKRPLVLAMLAAIPFLYAPIANFSDDHALLINASPSLPNWAFWLDKNFTPARGALIFFEPPHSELLTSHFGEKPQIFGKRILGMPGDRVRHDGKTVLINNRLVARTKLKTRKSIPLTKGPEGVIPVGCYYVGTSHKHGFDSRYGEIGFICAPRIIGTGRAIL